MPSTATYCGSKGGMSNTMIPAAIGTTDHKINCLPPYSFILYQFSSDLKAFGKRIPYQRFIFILRITSGTETIIETNPSAMYVTPKVRLT